MSKSDSVNVNVAVLYDGLASEINKTYQNLPWALKHEVVFRLKHQVHNLSHAVEKAKQSHNLMHTKK